MQNLSKIDTAKDLVTKEWVEAQDFLPSSAFTKLGIKNALGIADWALAASKPSYNFSEIGSKPTTLSGYGITDGVIYSNNIDVSSNASFKHIGYGYTNKGWWECEGPSMAFGAHDGTYVKLSFPNYNEYYQSRIVYQHRRNSVTSDWIEIITKNTIGEHAVRISNQGATLPTTYNESVCTFVTGKNGWKATGAAMIVNTGGVYTGLFNFRGYNTSDLTQYPRLFINVNHDGVVGQWAEVITDKNIGDYAMSKAGGTVTGQIYIETSAGDRFIHSKCDTAHIAFGIGAGGDNRGIYDIKYGKWWIVRNNSDYTEIVSSTMSLVGKVNVTGVLEARNGITLGNVTRTSWPVEGISKDTYLMPTNAFDHSGRLEHSYAANALYAADKRFSVSGSGFSYFNASQLFDGSYEGGYCARVETGATATMTISNNGSNIIAGYPYGDIYLSFYYNNVPADVKVEVYCNYASQGIGWKTLTLGGKRGDYNDVWYYNNSYHNVTQLRITITASASIAAALTEIDWHLSRAALSNLPIVTKFGIEQTLYGHMKFANNVTFESAAGHNVKFDGYALNVNAGLYIGSGYSLRLNGQPITKWSDLGTYITPISSETTSEKTISPNTFYKWGSVSALSITLGAATNNTHINNYMFEFTASTGFALGGLSGVKWADGVKPNIKAGYTYQFSIINNCATYSAFKTA